MVNAAAQKTKQLLDDCTESTQRVVDVGELGRRLKRLRKQAKKSQRELARACAVTPSFLSDCERGNRRLSDDRVAKYVEACL